jgi:hypothetical protein
MLEITQPCGFAAVRTAKTGTNIFGHYFLGYFKVVGQTVPRLEAGQGLLLPDADFVP